MDRPDLDAKDWSDPAIRAAWQDGYDHGREGADEVIASWQQIANDLRDERDLYRDGIAEHRDSYPPYAGEPERRLWSLLDSGGDR